VRQIGAAIAVVALTAAPAASGARPAQRLYVALGDSYAAGVGASEPTQTGYVPLLFRALQSPGVWRVEQLRNVAVSGETAGSILDGQLDAALRTIADPTDTRVVTLSIGGNDALGDPACAADPAACGLADRYATLLARLRAALRADPGREAIAVLTYPNPWSGTGLAFETVASDALVGADGHIDCAGGPDDVGLNDVLACVGARFGVLTADLYLPALGRGIELTHIATGDVHLNDVGHQLSARMLASVLRSRRCAAAGAGHRVIAAARMTTEVGRRDATRPGAAADGVPHRSGVASQRSRHAFPSYRCRRLDRQEREEGSCSSHPASRAVTSPELSASTPLPR
jgi:lysophospholipase L1-like esterase